MIHFGANFAGGGGGGTSIRQGCDGRCLFRHSIGYGNSWQTCNVAAGKNYDHAMLK
jgi:hypothetical protein